MSQLAHTCVRCGRHPATAGRRLCRDCRRRARGGLGQRVRGWALIDREIAPPTAFRRTPKDGR